MKYQNSFNNVIQNPISRKFGGHTVGVADPYVTGYHFIKFYAFPAKFAVPDWASCGSLTSLEAQIMLENMCMSVTPPGGTLSKIEFPGLGGIKWAVPGNIDYGNSVSVKWFELHGLPIINIMHFWVKMIRDYRYGASNLDEPNYTKKDYSATMFYWTTAPDIKTVEYAVCFDGMFPARDPQDLLNSDIESQGKLDIEIEFNVDYAWHEQWVYDKCKTYALQVANNKLAVGQYGKVT